MSRNAFEEICRKLEDHSVFSHQRPGRPRKPQVHPRVQLLVTFYRLGSNGSSASVGKVARHFGIGEGTILDYTRRGLTAILSLEKDVIKWPTLEDKELTKERVETKSGFPNCIGFVDGTLVVLEYKPQLEGADYFSRKGSYGISSMVVCNHEGRIIYMFTGFCGSAHDMLVFRHSKLVKEPARFFSEDDYLLADSGYACSQRVISSYKKPAASIPENERFNYLLSRSRIKVEHCIGMLKGRFPCLRGLRLQLRDAKDHKRAVLMVRACSVLHNLLLNDFYDEDWTINEVAEGEQNQRAGAGQEEGTQKRDRLKLAVLAAKGMR